MAHFLARRSYVYLAQTAFMGFWILAVLKPFQFWWWVLFGFLSSLNGVKLISGLKFSRLRLWRLCAFLSVYFWSTLIFVFLVNGRASQYFFIFISSSALYFFLNNFFKYRHDQEGQWEKLVTASLPIFILTAFFSLSSFFAAQVFFGVSFSLLLPGLGLMVFLISYIMQWFWAVSSPARIVASLVFSLIMVELFISVYLFPLSNFVSGGILLFAWILLLNSMRLLGDEDRQARKLWFRFLYLSVGGIIVVVITSQF